MEGKTSHFLISPLDQKTPCGVVSGAVWQLFLWCSGIPLPAYLHHVCHGRRAPVTTRTAMGRPSPLSPYSTQGAFFPPHLLLAYTLLTLHTLIKEKKHTHTHTHTHTGKALYCSSTRESITAAVFSKTRQGVLLWWPFAKVTQNRLVVLLTVQFLLHCSSPSFTASVWWWWWWWWVLYLLERKLFTCSFNTEKLIFIFKEWCNKNYHLGVRWDRGEGGTGVTAKDREMWDFKYLIHCTGCGVCGCCWTF